MSLYIILYEFLMIYYLIVKTLEVNMLSNIELYEL